MMTASMRNILLVGGKPSRSKTLMSKKGSDHLKKWLEDVLETETRLVLISKADPKFSQQLIFASLNKYQIIALGDDAAYALHTYGITNFFKLPHPNHKVATKKLTSILAKCKSWIYRP